RAAPPGAPRRTSPGRTDPTPFSAPPRTPPGRMRTPAPAGTRRGGRRRATPLRSALRASSCTPSPGRRRTGGLERYVTGRVVAPLLRGQVALHALADFGGERFDPRRPRSRGPIGAAGDEPLPAGGEVHRPHPSGVAGQHDRL